MSSKVIANADAKADAGVDATADARVDARVDATVDANADTGVASRLREGHAMAAEVTAVSGDAGGRVHSLHPAVGPTRALALGSVLGLIVLGLSWELWLAPTGSGTLAIKVAPLLLALPGLLRSRLYTFRWLSMLVWLYFAEGAVRATSEAGMSQSLAIAEVLLSLCLFTACALQVRGRLAGARIAAISGSQTP